MSDIERKFLDIRFLHLFPYTRGPGPFIPLHLIL